MVSPGTHEYHRMSLFEALLAWSGIFQNRHRRVSSCRNLDTHFGSHEVLDPCRSCYKQQFRTVQSPAKTTQNRFLPCVPKPTGGEKSTASAQIAFLCREHSRPTKPNRTATKLKGRPMYAAIETVVITAPTSKPPHQHRNRTQRRLIKQPA